MFLEWFGYTIDWTTWNFSWFCRRPFSHHLDYSVVFLWVKTLHWHLKCLVNVSYFQSDSWGGYSGNQIRHKKTLGGFMVEKSWLKSTKSANPQVMQKWESLGKSWLKVQLMMILDLELRSSKSVWSPTLDFSQVTLKSAIISCISIGTWHVCKYCTVWLIPSSPCCCHHHFLK